LNDNIQRSTILSMSDKRYGYEVSAGKQKFIANEDFYEVAVPLAPIKYDHYKKTKTMTTKQGEEVTLFIGQVFPKRYEKLR